jgi:predicted lipoprotein with Yx(FWY)xxD motif
MPTIRNSYLAKKILAIEYLSRESSARHLSGGNEMRSTFVLTGGMVAAALLAAACGSSSTGAGNPYGAPAASPSPAPVATPSANPTPSVATGTTIGVGSTRLGQVLVDASGRTLYLFAADTGTASTCNSSACVQYWPPVLTTGAPQAGSGVNQALLGTTARQDGSTEVTYAGHPLYYFLSDKKPGDVTGQGVNGFGGPWYVVSPSGMQIG